MKKYQVGLICLWVGLSSFAAAWAEPQNIGLLKRELIAYQESGKYRQQQTQVIAQAEKYIDQQVRANETAGNPKKLAIILDIDETAISNFDDLRYFNFGGTQEEIVAAAKKANQSAIPPVLNLYRFAKSHNVSVFFVTGRREAMAGITQKVLKNNGYYNWNGLFMKPDDYDKSSVIPYKKSIRKKLTDMGYDIIANIGDQDSDLVGGYADKTFKLPNPFYYVP